MKHLLTLLMLFISTVAAAQIPTMPWNPDENGDQFVGMNDLLELLAVYGQEFENAIVAEDGESAIMYIGELSYFECDYSCHQLPGFWTLPSATDLVPVYPELHAGGNYDYTQTWIDKGDFDGLGWNSFPYYYGKNSSGERKIYSTETAGTTKKCFCSVKQLPRVEYTYCSDYPLQDCADALVNDGWLPLGGLSSPDIDLVHQAFWRFAQ